MQVAVSERVTTFSRSVKSQDLAPLAGTSSILIGRFPIRTDGPAIENGPSRPWCVTGAHEQAPRARGRMIAQFALWRGMETNETSFSDGALRGPYGAPKASWHGKCVCVGFGPLQALSRPRDSLLLSL